METGFRRITWVVAALLAAIYLLGTTAAILGEVIIVTLSYFALPWGIFYAMRWIALGFRGEK